MHQIPIFMLIISDGEEMSPTLKMPIFSVGPGGHIVSFKCAGSAKITKLAVNSLNKSRLQDHCSFEGKLLRIAYNNVAPYFHVKSDQMDENSLEYLYLQTFIRKYKLIPELNFAGMTWGAKDGRTGLWNGVVGMVNYRQGDPIPPHLFAGWIWSVRPGGDSYELQCGESLVHRLHPSAWNRRDGLGLKTSTKTASNHKYFEYIRHDFLDVDICLHAHGQCCPARCVQGWHFLRREESGLCGCFARVIQVRSLVSSVYPAAYISEC